MRKITVMPVLNGFTVEVGCQTVVFEGRTSLIGWFSEYVNDPFNTEQRFIGQSVNKAMMGDQAQAAMASPAERESLSAVEDRLRGRAIDGGYTSGAGSSPATGPRLR